VISRRAFRLPESWTTRVSARAALALLVVFLYAPPASPQDGALDVLDQCIDYLHDGDGDAEHDLQWPELTEACPDLEGALEASEYAPWLPEAWRERVRDDPGFITFDGLVELERLLAAEREPREPRSVNTNSLPEVLDGLDRADETFSVTWWERVLEWIRERIPRQSGGDSGWLADLLSDLGRHETLLRVLGYGLFAAIVLIALGIVVNEMRVAGVFDARLRGRGASAEHATAQVSDVSSTLPAERFAALIDRILDAVGADRRGTLDASATHRELARGVRWQQDDERASFARLIDCAERVRYAATRPPASEIDSALEHGARLLARVDHRARERRAKPR